MAPASVGGVSVVPAVLASGIFFVLCLLAWALRASGSGRGSAVSRQVSAYAPIGAAQRVFAPAQIPLLAPAPLSSLRPFAWLLQRFPVSRRVPLRLARAGIPLRVGEYVLLQWGIAVAGLVAVQAATGSLPLGALAGGVGLTVMPLYVRRRAAKRRQAFEDGLSDLLNFLINALKSGYSFQEAIAVAAREMADPVGPEFAQALKEIRIGSSVESALSHMNDRIGSKDFELIVTAVLIQREVGGNLTEILSNIAHTVRERHRILRQARVLTAQERMSGYVIAALPVAMVALLMVMSPGYLDRLWDLPLGRFILAAAFGLEIVGLLVIRKIVEIEV